jgi:hypothetical protein
MLRIWNEIDWGSAPGYFGGISVLLALSIILRDRRNSDRAQVDQIAAWPKVSYERQFPGVSKGGRRIEEGQVDTYLKNSSGRPVRIIQVAWIVETRWFVPAGELAYTTVPGIDVRRSFTGDPFWLPPDDEPLTGSMTVNVAHLAPKEAVTLDPIVGIVARPEWIIVVDNGGRAWELLPGRRHRPRRIRWYTRARDHQPARFLFGRIKLLKIE